MSRYKKNECDALRENQTKTTKKSSINNNEIARLVHSTQSKSVQEKKKTFYFHSNLTIRVENNEIRCVTQQKDNEKKHFCLFMIPM